MTDEHAAARPDRDRGRSGLAKRVQGPPEFQSTGSGRRTSQEWRSPHPDRLSAADEPPTERCLEMLLVVRHADAGDKRSWTGPDSRRPLSPTGRRQAEGLVVRLEDCPVDRVLSSPTLRCRQTVQPLARSRLVDIEPMAELGLDASPSQLRALFWDRALHNAVLCTHGETIGRLFEELFVEGLVVVSPLPGPMDWPKGSTWVLQRTAQRQVYGHFLAPLALDGFRNAAP